jgi:AhpD family alkylhydroperoxidase
MDQRLAFKDLAPEAYEALATLDRYVRRHVDGTLLHLVKLRASILNGCSFCVDMHSRDALAHGEDSRRLFGVGAWEDSPFFSDRERAALALTDAVTRLAPGGVSDEVWGAAAAAFEEEDLSALLAAIIGINAWNRLAVPTRLAVPR